MKLTRIKIGIPKDKLPQLRRLAKERGMSISGYIRSLLLEMMQKGAA